MTQSLKELAERLQATLTIPFGVFDGDDFADDVRAAIQLIDRIAALDEETLSNAIYALGIGVEMPGSRHRFVNADNVAAAILALIHGAPK